MPSLKIIISPTSMIPVIYLIDQAVGRGGANRRADVLLVQFFIRLLQDQPQKFDGEQYNFIPGKSKFLAVDGVCGEETIRAITHFKNEHDKGARDKNSAENMLKDGRVDPMIAGNPFGARTGRVLSILRLNQDVVESVGVERFRKLHAERLFPQELKNFFFI